MDAASAGFFWTGRRNSGSRINAAIASTMSAIATQTTGLLIQLGSVSVDAVAGCGVVVGAAAGGVAAGGAAVGAAAGGVAAGGVAGSG